MIPHGTRSKYVNDMCRCDDCTQANTDRQRAYAKTPNGAAAIRRARARTNAKRRAT